jgi:hypothetical protein
MLNYLDPYDHSWYNLKKVIEMRATES